MTPVAIRSVPRGRSSALTLPRERTLFVVAIALSLAFHGFILLPTFVQVLTGSSAAALARADFAPHSIREREAKDRTPEELEEDRRREEELRLGIADSDKATINWIGFKEYEEHLARLAEVEQPALTRVDRAGSEGAAPTPPAPTTEPDDSAMAAATAAASTPNRPEGPPTPLDPFSEPEAKQQQARGAPTEESPAAPPVDEPAPLPPNEPSPTTRPPSDFPSPNPKPPDEPPTEPATDPQPAPQTPEPTPVPPSDAPLPDPHPTDDPIPVPPQPPPETAPPTEPKVPVPASPAPPQPTDLPPADRPTEAAPPTEASPRESTTEAMSENSTRPAAVGPPRPVPTEDGEFSDSESDAFSIQNVPANLWKNGRPIAANGLTIKTRKPRFTVLTMVTANPKNPVVELRFDSEGKPAVYRFLRRSGHEDIDGPILDALASWRAEGEALTKLPPGETATVRLKLILVN